MLSDGNQRKRERTKSGSTDGHVPRGETEFRSSSRTGSAPPLATEPAGDSSLHCPISQHAPPSATSFLPHLLRLTAEEIAAAPAIDAETFPELSLVESLPETLGSHASSPDVTLRASPLTGDGLSDVHSGARRGSLKAPRPTPSPRKTPRRSPEGTHSPRSLGAAGPDLLKSQRQATCPDGGPRTPRSRSDAETR